MSQVDEWTQQYLDERAAAERRLCVTRRARLALRDEAAFYGCPFCRGQYHRRNLAAFGWKAQGYLYVRCRNCNVVYPWPRLTREALATRVNAPWVNRYLERNLERAFETTVYWPSYVPFPEVEFKNFTGSESLRSARDPGSVGVSIGRIFGRWASVLDYAADSWLRAIRRSRNFVLFATKV